MCNTLEIRETCSPETLCLETCIDSKLPDTILIISAIAMLIIGSLAASGVFTAMNRVNALYLAYGMFAGAGISLFLEIAKTIFKHVRSHSLRSRELNPEQLNQKMKKIKQVIIGENAGKPIPALFKVTVVLENGKKIHTVLDTVEITILKDGIQGKTRSPSEFDHGRHSRDLEGILTQIFNNH